MKNKTKKKCKKYKHTIGVNNGFCKWQIPYRTEKEQEFRDMLMRKIMEELE